MRKRKPSSPAKPSASKIAAGISAAREDHDDSKKSSAGSSVKKTKKNPRGAGRKPKFNEPLKNKPFLLPLSWHEEIDDVAAKFFGGNVSELGRVALREYLNKIKKN